MPKVTYTLQGDYLLPYIILSEPPDAEPLTKYGLMRKNFLKQHNPLIYSKMLSHEELYPHCREVQQKANEHMDLIMKHFMAKNPQPSKKLNKSAWAKFMEKYRLMAEEAILCELIYR